MDKTKKGSKAPRPLSEAKGKKQPAAHKPKLVSKPAQQQKEQGNAPVEERLQKVLAEAGVASRRSSEQLILQRRVRVNGNLVTELGTKVDPHHDLITVDNKPLPQQGAEQKVYIALHKPRGYVTTADDEQGRETVLDLLDDVKARVYPVGRLDNNSEGLLLLTNDGDLTFRLTHPRYKVDKEYEVQTESVPSEDDLKALRIGIVLDDGVRTQPATVELLHEENGRAWIRFIISEGRKRQIRNMLEAVGQRTRRLIRVRIGPLRLGDLKRGEHRSLSSAEVRALYKAVGLGEGATTTALTSPPAVAAQAEPVMPSPPSRFVRQGGEGASYQGERPARSARPNAGGRAFPANRNPTGARSNHPQPSRSGGSFSTPARPPAAKSSRPTGAPGPRPSPATGNPGPGKRSRVARPAAGGPAAPPRSARPFPTNGNPTTTGRPSRPAAGGNRPAPGGGRSFPSNGNPPLPARPAGTPPSGNRVAPGGYRPPKAGPAAPGRGGPPSAGSRPSRPSSPGSGHPSRPSSPGSGRPSRPASGGGRPPTVGGNRSAPHQGSRPPAGSKPQRGSHGGNKRER